MAPVHRLAVELSDQGEAAALLPPTNGLVMKNVALVHRITAKRFSPTHVMGDAFTGEWSVEAFSRVGLIYEKSTRTASANYLEGLPLFTAGRVRLPDDGRMVYQLVSLKRETSPSGKDRVIHPRAGSDDLANAAVGAIVLASTDTRPALVKQGDLLRDGAPVPVPAASACLITVVVANRHGQVGVMYAARADRRVRFRDLNADWWPITILYFEAGPVWPTLFADVAARAIEWAERCGAAVTRDGTRAGLMYVSPVLRRQAEVAGLQVTPVPAELAGPLDQMFVGAAMHIQRGLVKLSDVAYERARSSPVGGALDFRGGDSQDDVLRRAALTMISVCHDNE
jgi:hypothetical protein